MRTVTKFDKDVSHEIQSIESISKGYNQVYINGGLFGIIDKLPCASDGSDVLVTFWDGRCSVMNKHIAEYRFKQDNK